MTLPIFCWAGRGVRDVDASRAESLFREVLVINPANESAALALSDVFRQGRRFEDAKDVSINCSRSDRIQ